MPEREQTFCVTPELSGRLDSALASLSGASRSQAGSWVQTGRVWVEGKPANKAGQRLRGGEELRVLLPCTEPPQIAAEQVALEVLFEDEHLIAVNKPAGMVTHPAPAVHSGTLVNALMGRMALPQQEGAEGAGSYRPGIVHRLDKDTSGVIVVAKTLSAHAALSAAFKERTVQKAYLAIAGGQWKATSPQKVALPIGRHPVQRQRMTTGGAGAREALTHFVPLARNTPAGRTLALVRCLPHTGRTHQIRVHLQHLGSPIVGDTVYGRASAAIGRQALHAWGLRIPHPVGGQLELHAPVPADILEAWVALGGALPALSGPWE